MTSLISMGKSDLSIFVESLFDQQGSRLSNGAISVEMIGIPRFLVIRFYEDTNRKTVEININGINMGYFEVHPTFRVIRQSCNAYSLSLKYSSSLKPYALRFITLILLFIPSTFPVDI